MPQLSVKRKTPDKERSPDIYWGGRVVGSVHLRVTFNLFHTLLGNVYLRVIFNLFHTLLGIVYPRVTFNLSHTLLGSV